MALPHSPPKHFSEFMFYGGSGFYFTILASSETHSLKFQGSVSYFRFCALPFSVRFSVFFSGICP